MPTQPRQSHAALLRFIRGYRTQHGYSPTAREMATAIGASATIVLRKLAELEASGQLRRSSPTRGWIPADETDDEPPTIGEATEPDEPLSPRQRDLLVAFHRLYVQNGVAPTIRELSVTLGISSPNAVTQHLARLRRNGYVAEQQAKAARATVLTPAGLRAAVTGQRRGRRK